MRWTVVGSSMGGVGLGVADEAVVKVTFGVAASTSGAGVSPGVAGSAVLAEARRQMGEFLSGARIQFDLPVVVQRGSDFERAVWTEIAAIPYGQTSTYGALARAVGEPGAAQAVGTACNRNPLPVIVPCHRVIGSDGKLVGFGGGLHRKRWLLQLETRIWIEQAFTSGLA